METAEVFQPAVSHTAQHLARLAWLLSWSCNAVEVEGLLGTTNGFHSDHTKTRGTQAICFCASYHVKCFVLTRKRPYFFFRLRQNTEGTFFQYKTNSFDNHNTPHPKFLSSTPCSLGPNGLLAVSTQFEKIPIIGNIWNFCTP